LPEIAFPIKKYHLCNDTQITGAGMDYKEHYRIDALEFDYWGADQFSPTELRRNQFVYKLCSIKEGDKVLDIGSGRGWFSLYAAKLGARVTALDLSKENLNKIKELNSSVNTVYGDACAVPVTDEQFDLIVALEVLEHIVEPHSALENWQKLLKPGAKLLVTVPYKEVIRYSLCIHCNQKTPVNAHLHSFDKKTLVKLFNKHGYWVKETVLFCHKLPNVLKINSLLRMMPYGLWRFIDTISGIILPQKYSYIAVIATLKDK